MALQRVRRQAGGDVPELECPVVAGRCECPAIGRERQAPDFVLVAGESAGASLVVEVPLARPAIEPPDDQRVSLGGESEGAAEPNVAPRGLGQETSRRRVDQANPAV